MSELLALTAARVEAISGEVLAASLDLAVRGPRAVVVGDVGPLVALLTGRARLAAGEARVLGRSLEEARADVSVAPRDPPLLDDLTPLAHVAWAARLAGMNGAAARAASLRACALAELGPWASRPLSGAPLAVRRVTVLAGAASSSPALLFAEAPLDGLDDASATIVLATLGRLVGDRAAVVSTPSEPIAGSPAASLLEGATDVVYR